MTVHRRATVIVVIIIHGFAEERVFTFDNRTDKALQSSPLIVIVMSRGGGMPLSLFAGETASISSNS